MVHFIGAKPLDQKQSLAPLVRCSCSNLKAYIQYSALSMCVIGRILTALSADAETIWCVRSIFCNDGYVFPLHARCEYEVPRQA